MFRESYVGQVFYVDKTRRTDIHKIAKRTEIDVQIQKVHGGFKVTRIAKDGLKGLMKDVRGLATTLPSQTDAEREQAESEFTRNRLKETMVDTDFDFGA